MTEAAEILALLRDYATVGHQRGRLSDEDLTVRGVWQTSYRIRLAETSSVLCLEYVVVQAFAQGCSYYEPRLGVPKINDGLLGANILEHKFDHVAWEIAALDAICARLVTDADAGQLITGSNIDKAQRRAQIVIGEVERLVGAIRKTRQTRVVNVGVVGDFIALLARDERLDTMASDYAEDLVGTRVNGVLVEHGSQTERLVAEADVALITGMTLANGSLDRILAVAREHGTRTVLFAQTGAHFADVYRELGVDAVVAEPLPFYLSGDGPSRIKIFRRGR